MRFHGGAFSCKKIKIGLFDGRASRVRFRLWYRVIISIFRTRRARECTQRTHGAQSNIVRPTNYYLLKRSDSVVNNSIALSPLLLLLLRYDVYRAVFYRLRRRRRHPIDSPAGRALSRHRVSCRRRRFSANKL